MDVLETYPRDELFQTPVEDLVPIAAQVMYTRERRQLRLFVRRDLYGRFLSCLVYLPRDRYNTTVRERIAAILKEQLARRPHRVHRARGGVLRGAAALRRTPGAGPADRRARHGRPRAPAAAEAARSWRDDFTSAVIVDLRRGARQPLRAALRRLLPGGLQGGLPAADRRRRPRPARADRGRRGHDALALRGRRRATRRGPAEGLPDRPAALALRGAADPLHDGCRGRRRAALPARGPGAGVLHLRLRAALPPRACPTDARELFQDTVAAVWNGYNESDGFNALVLAAGLTWRQATLLRAYAKYMRQGGTPFAQDYIEDALRNNVDITRYLVQLFEARFDPGPQRRASRRTARRGRRKCADLEERIVRALDDGLQPRPRPHPALLPDQHPRDAAHQLLPDRRRRPTAAAALAEDGPVGDPRPARAAAEVRDLRLLARASRACTCASARWRAVACAGPTDATTSAPRSSAWSRRRWSRTP